MADNQQSRQSTIFFTKTLDDRIYKTLDRADPGWVMELLPHLNAISSKLNHINDEVSSTNTTSLHEP